MPKILSQSGVSLADTYDIEGSIAGVENLESKDVHLFDEMGGRVFSERLLSFNIRMTSGAVAQNITWNTEAAGIPDSINRVLGVFVFIVAADTTEVANCQVSYRDQNDLTEIPIFTWDDGTDPEIPIRYADNSATSTGLIQLRSSVSLLPGLLTRYGEEEDMPSIVFRGVAAGFGAGTVTCVAYIHLCRANRGNPAPGAPSSHGLPLPGW